ncbi:MAG: hypothetical protein ACI8UO_003431 [Verrucomicrobiales bacterium]|jgi:hypothetical protein
MARTIARKPADATWALCYNFHNMTDNPYAPPSVIDLPRKRVRSTKPVTPILAEAKLAWQLPIISLGLGAILLLSSAPTPFISFLMVTSILGGGAFTALAAVRGIRNRDFALGRNAISGALVTSVCSLAAFV